MADILFDKIELSSLFYKIGLFCTLCIDGMAGKVKFMDATVPEGLSINVGRIEGIIKEIKSKL